MGEPAPKSIDDYLSRVPRDQRAALEQLRERIGRAAPGAEEYISYQIPTFKYRSRPLVAFAAFAKHCSFFPMSMAVIGAHARELAGYPGSGKGTIRFTAVKPLPGAVVRGIVKARMIEIDEREAARTAKRTQTQKRAPAPRRSSARSRAR